MKQFLFITTLMAVVCTSSHAQSNNAEQAVNAVLQQMADAFMKNDATVLEKIYADTYIFSDPGGVVHNKKDMVDYVNGGNLKFESVIPSDKKITVYENTAVLTEHTTEKGHVGDEDIAGEYRWMYIFHKEGSDWKIVAVQGTRIMQDTSVK